LIPLKAAAEDVREAIAMFNLIGELNATPERQSNPIRSAMVLTMTTPGTVIARHVRKELSRCGQAGQRMRAVVPSPDLM